MNTTTLYRYFDFKGQLLYVGITKNQFNRASQHSKDSPWFSEIMSARFEHLETREAALKAESNAIATELPKFNKAGPVLSEVLLDHLLKIVSECLEDEWHKSMSLKISNRMLVINEFSTASEVTKLGFSLAASFVWNTDGTQRIIGCAACEQLANSKWFDYIQDESQSIIDEYQVSL